MEALLVDIVCNARYSGGKQRYETGVQTSEDIVFEPRYDVAIVAVFQYGQCVKLLAGEMSMTCLMPEARFDRTYDSDPGKNLLVFKCLQFANRRLLFQRWKSISVSVKVALDLELMT